MIFLLVLFVIDQAFQEQKGLSPGQAKNQCVEWFFTTGMLPDSSAQITDHVSQKILTVRFL
jgi:hypothetical protein